MKIRIKGNSIRYRLTKKEIDIFEKSGHLEEKTDFPTGVSLCFSLQKQNNIRQMEASFAGNRICIFVPEKMAEEWTTTDTVGLEGKMNISQEKDLFLLIEKDFVCIEHTSEDQDDNYPNPNKSLPGGSQAG